MKKPEVTLINVTSQPLEMLILAKSTRLEMTPSLLHTILGMSQEKKMKEIEYIANTIPSSWEFVDFTFLIQNVTRAFTHQFVRGRHASYAQQTMRVLNVEDFEVTCGPSIVDSKEKEEAIRKGEGCWPTTNKEIYEGAVDTCRDAYKDLIANGAKIEDARGILPTNIQTNILAKMNLRTFTETVRKRSSSRVQGEYREVIELMKMVTIDHLPWVKFFVERTFDKAAAELEEEINSTGWGLSDEKRLRMVKLIDQMRMQS